MTTTATMANAGRVATAAAATGRSALTINMHLPAVIITAPAAVIATAIQIHIRLGHHHRPATITAIHVTDTAGQGQHQDHAQDEREMSGQRGGVHSASPMATARQKRGAVASVR